MLKKQIREKRWLEKEYCLWAGKDGRDMIAIEEGSREKVEVLYDDDEKIDQILDRVYAKRDHEEKRLQEVEKKYPKKHAYIEGKEIVIMNKNGSEFKRITV